MATPDKAIEFFVYVHGFCKEFESDMLKHQLGTKYFV